MPKLKTHKGLAKRVRVTATGKVVYKRAFGGHLMSHKSGNRVRGLRKHAGMVPVMATKARRALGL
ncbi:MAG: 50S ribosomal protein L35 [Sedimentisphaerales bacterium]|nr:50S ribosomal protein L35 [Sedimentisphaerales bacterium]MBN2843781.1 50S ribosomal protein L35 [Sedimentisphaerales bacterium]